MSITKVDVFVSGAGPVGLFFAYQMAILGHSVYCVDPKPGPTDQSRAVLITSRTMEILEEKGFAPAFLSDAIVLHGVRMLRNGVEKAAIDSQGDTSYPHATLVMQGITERIFNDRINEDTDLKVHWNTELLLYTQEEDYVSCIVRDINTLEEKTIQTTYIVGADGTHSKVRKGSSDWTYEGNAVMTKFFLADLTIKGEALNHLKDRMNSFMKGTYVMGIVRLNPLHESPDQEHKYRVFANVEAYSLDNKNKEEIRHGLAKKEDPPSLEYVQEWMDKLTDPIKLEASDLDWSSFFRINERMANGFRRGRAFLIGDAAHCHSPGGGQGMNLGLQDADNLAWKMSYVLKNLVSDPESLLNSYCIEREPYAKSTIETTSSATKAVLSDNNFSANMRGILISTALMMPQVGHFIFKNMMQLNVTICKESPLTGVSDKGLIAAGQFLPETGPLRKTFFPKSSKLPRSMERKNLREILVDNDKFVAIFIDTTPASVKPRTEQLELFWKLTRNLPIRRIVVRSSWHCPSASMFPSFITKEEEPIAETCFYSEERIDSPMSVMNRITTKSYYDLFFSSETPCVVLIVRPDLYVANATIITNNDTLQSSLKYFDSIFPNNKTI